MRKAIQQYLHTLDHLARLVPGRFRGLIEIDGLTYEVWHNRTIELIPHVG